MATSVTQQPEPDVPTILAISASILSVGVTSQPNCDLLDLTNEVLLCVLKTPNLDVFDKACLALTCKQFGNLIYGFERELKPMGKLRSGNEELRLEMLEDEYWSDDGLQEDQYVDLARSFEDRVQPEPMSKFLQRLDTDWNQDKELRFCHGCGVFRSVTEKYWDQRKSIYEYIKVNTVAINWRRMRDCYCDCDPVRLVEAWVEHGSGGYKTVKQGDRGCAYSMDGFWYIRCPDCALSMNRDHDGCCGCGCCGSCDCGCC